MSRTPMRTVLVDDVEEMRDLLRVVLTRDGRFTIVGEASTGIEAIDVVGAQRPDLVVLDLDMPMLDGLGALPKLRELVPSARIVVLSGYPAEDMERPALERGAVGYIEKRSDVEVLPSELHALATVLGTVQHVLDRPYETSAEARRDVREALSSKASPSATEVVELLSSELVTNALRHAQSVAQVAVTIRGGRVRVGVTDHGPGTPAPREPKADEAGGRGLLFVTTFASDWGVDVGEGTKTVWFEVEL